MPETLKRLYILRHASATAGSAEIRDINRPLSESGLDDARSLGIVLKDKGYIPEVILCSPARRTRETYNSLKSSQVFDAPVFYNEKLYDGATGDLLHEIQKIDPQVHSILMIGHNPFIHNLATVLAGTGKENMLQRLHEGFKPATLCVLDCPCETWADVRPGVNTLIDIFDPLDYNAPSRPTRWM